MRVKKQQLESDMEKQTGSKLGKEYVKAVYCHPAYVTYVQSTSYKMPGWMNTSWNQDRWEKYQYLKYADDTSLMVESKEELKSLLMKVKKESEKVGLKLNIQKMNIMVSSCITSWQIDRETVETMTNFILGGSKITAVGDWSHEIKRRLLLGRKVMTNLDHILKNRGISLPTKACLIKAVFSSSQVCMWDLDYKENWAIKN